MHYAEKDLCVYQEVSGGGLFTCIEKPLTTAGQGFLNTMQCLGFSQCNAMAQLRNIHMEGCLMPVKSNKY